MGNLTWPDWPLRYWWNEEKARDPVTSRVKPPPCRNTGLLATGDGPYPRTVLHGEAAVATFHIYRDTANQYRWRLRADNGRIVADSSEGYVQKVDCQNGIAILKREAPSAPVKDET